MARMRMRVSSNARVRVRRQSRRGVRAHRRAGRRRAEERVAPALARAVSFAFAVGAAIPFACALVPVPDPLPFALALGTLDGAWAAGTAVPPAVAFLREDEALEEVEPRGVRRAVDVEVERYTRRNSRSIRLISESAMPDTSAHVLVRVGIAARCLSTTRFE